MKRGGGERGEWTTNNENRAFGPVVSWVVCVEINHVWVSQHYPSRLAPILSKVSNAEIPNIRDTRILHICQFSMGQNGPQQDKFCVLWAIKYTGLKKLHYRRVAIVTNMSYVCTGQPFCYGVGQEKKVGFQMAFLRQLCSQV